MEKTSIGGKVGSSLFLMLFAISFSWFGFATGLPTLAGMLGQWYQARSYIAVPAMVRSTELKITRGDEADTRRALATFAYRYQGRDYLGDKVSTSPMSDNFDDYHATVHARLAQALAAGEAVTVWIDPIHPERALYDRNLRWKAVLFMIPFAVLFPAVGLGAWLAIGYIWLGRHGVARAGKLRGQSSPGPLEPLRTSFFAFFWNMVSWPIAALSLMDTMGEGALLVVLILLFPAIGLVLIWFAWTMWRDRWRIGRPMLELLHHPDAKGLVPLRGRVHFTPAFAVRMDPAQPSHRFVLSVKLQENAGSGEDATETTVWESCVADVALARGAARADFSAALPAELLAAQPPAGAQRNWKLELKALGATLVFDLDPIGPPAPAAF